MDEKMYCEIALKLEQTLNITYGILSQNNLTSSQSRTVEEIIAEIRGLKHLLNQEKKMSNKRFLVTRLTDLLGTLAELAIKFFDYF